MIADVLLARWIVRYVKQVIQPAPPISDRRHTPFCATERFISSTGTGTVTAANSRKTSK